MKRFLSFMLAFALLIAVLPVSAYAYGATNIKLYHPDVQDNSLMSISAQFYWTSGTVGNSYLVLTNKPMNGSAGEGYGDFSERGTYGYKFTSWESVLAEDAANNTFGILSYAYSGSITYHKTTSKTITFEKNLIDTTKNGTYFIYLWVEYPQGYYIPDNLFCVMQTNPTGDTNNKKVLFSPGVSKEPTNSHRNYYEGDNFYFAPDSEDGVLEETEHICFASDIWFCKNESAHVKRACDIRSCPNYNVEKSSASHVFTSATDPICDDCSYKRPGVNFTPPVVPVNPTTHEHKNILYDWNDNQHWQVIICNVVGCDKNGDTSNYGDHKYDNDKDTTCDCGYVRTISGGGAGTPAPEDPAAKPNTGDITHIPLWTGMILLGAAAMYLQLAQRKREHF